MRVIGLLILLAACTRGPTISITSEDLGVEPVVNFQRTAIGFSRVRAVTVMNRTRAPVEVTLSTTAPFSIAAGSLALEGGEVAEIEVTFTPQVVGPQTGALQVNTIDVVLTGDGVDVPTCTSPSACLVPRFDPDGISCVLEPATEGTRCGGAQECVDHGECRAGVCEGVAMPCDDGNACTRDACVVGQGCVSIDSSASCAAPADPCQAAVCDPVQGCGSVPVVDGTACGEVSCTTARVCLSGSCRSVTPPDGFECRAPTACQGAGVCRNRVCEVPSAQVLTPRWRYSPSPTNTLLRQLRFDGVSDAQGRWYWLECGDLTAQRRLGGGGVQPGEGATDYAAAEGWCEAISTTPDGVERFRTRIPSGLNTDFWSFSEPGRQLLSSGLFIFTMLNKTVAAVDVTTGALRWKTDNGTSSVSRVTQLADDGRGQLWLLMSNSDTRPSMVRSMIAALTISTGALRHQTAITGATTGLMIDAAGNAFSGSASSWQSHDPNGQLRFSVTGLEGPLLTVDDRVLGPRGFSMSTLDGSTTPASVMAPGPRPRVALSKQAVFSLINPVSGDSRVEAPLGSFDLPGRRLSNFWLTSAGDALFVSTSTSPLLNPFAEAYAISPRGADTMRCPLSAASTMAEVGYNGRTLAVRVNQTCPSCPGLSGVELQFYDVGPLGFASRGWVAPRGRPEGSGRPR